MLALVWLIPAGILVWKGLQSQEKDAPWLLAVGIWSAATFLTSWANIWTPLLGWITAGAALAVAFGIRRWVVR